jgi:hypothetical protein
MKIDLHASSTKGTAGAVPFVSKSILVSGILNFSASHKQQMTASAQHLRLLRAIEMIAYILRIVFFAERVDRVLNEFADSVRRDLALNRNAVSVSILRI